MSKKTDKTSPAFEDQMNRLEEIVQNLESGVPIEEALNYYEEGIKLSQKLESKLSEIERKVYQVKNIDKIEKNDEGDLKLELFE